jgi:hypothetical protein
VPREELRSRMTTAAPTRGARTTSPAATFEKAMECATEPAHVLPCGWLPGIFSSHGKITLRPLSATHSNHYFPRGRDMRPRAVCRRRRYRRPG